MPTYEYLCDECGSTLDRLVKIADREQPQTCECGGQANFGLFTPPRIDWLGMSYTSDSPEFKDHFENRIKKQKAREEKCMEANGDYGSAPGA